MGLFDIFEGRHVCKKKSCQYWCFYFNLTSRSRFTFLLVDLEVDVRVEGDDDNVRCNVYSADDVHDAGVLHRDFFGYLHHPKDDDQVGTVI